MHDDTASGPRVSRRDALEAGLVLIGLAIGCDGAGGSDAGAIDSSFGVDAGATDSGPNDAEIEADAGPRADWQLAPGHFIPAKMPMRIVTPRPASEIGADSAYLWAHEGVRYEVPIGVSGGAWPFLFELVDAPTGMTIGDRLIASGDTLVRPADYGVVQWTPPPGSNSTSESYTVRVTDQEGNTVDVTVAVQVDNDKFVFVAPGAGGGSGTVADPLLGFDAMYGGLYSDTTYAGRHAYFRAGNYAVTGGSDSNQNVRLGGSNKPKVLRAFPDEQPVFDCATAKVLFGGGGMDDAAICGIRWENGRQDVNNAHFIWANSGFDRGLFWRNHFYELQRGTVGNDNPAAIFLSASTNHREHIAIISNVFEAMGPGGGNGVAGYDSYALDYSLFENNEARACRSSYCLWLKGGHRWTTVRGERATDDNQVGTVLLNISLGRDGRTEASEQVEVSYCTVVNRGGGDTLRFHWASSANMNGPIWIYRCTVEGDVGALNRDESEVTVERCVFTDTDIPMGTTITNVEHATVSAGTLDAELALTGSARNDYLGTHGAEVA